LDNVLGLFHHFGYEGVNFTTGAASGDLLWFLVLGSGLGWLGQRGSVVGQFVPWKVFFDAFCAGFDDFFGVFGVVAVGVNEGLDIFDDCLFAVDMVFERWVFFAGSDVDGRDGCDFEEAVSGSFTVVAHRGDAPFSLVFVSVEWEFESFSASVHSVWAVEFVGCDVTEFAVLLGDAFEYSSFEAHSCGFFGIGCAGAAVYPAFADGAVVSGGWVENAALDFVLGG